MVVYEQCVPHKGCGKVRCLVHAILSDLRSGKISKRLAGRRLVALIYYNRINRWCRHSLVRRYVVEAGVKANIFSRDPCKIAQAARRHCQKSRDPKICKIARRYEKMCK
jgi:hypothetical protein